MIRFLHAGATERQAIAQWLGRAAHEGAALMGETPKPLSWPLTVKIVSAPRNTLTALLLGRIGYHTCTEGPRIIDELEALPDKITRILSQNEHIRRIAEKYAGSQAMMFLGRQFNGPCVRHSPLRRGRLLLPGVFARDRNGYFIRAAADLRASPDHRATARCCRARARRRGRCHWS